MCYSIAYSNIAYGKVIQFHCRKLKLADKRSFFREGLNSELTQGSVFYGALVEDYNDKINYGLIITARCDISQNKAPVYSYLPLVSFDNWLVQEFPLLLHNKIKKSVYNSLVSAFINIGGSELLLDTYDLEKLKDSFSDAGSNKQRTSFHNKIEDFYKLNNLLSGDIGVNEIKSLITSSKIFSSACESILDDLISQNLLGYYFVDDITNDGPHVIKLRDVYHLKSDYAVNLRNGINLKNVNYLNDNEKLSFTVGKIKSPYIEHILQKFSNVFTRIGIDDPDKNMIKDMIGN